MYKYTCTYNPTANRLELIKHQDGAYNLKENRNDVETWQEELARYPVNLIMLYLFVPVIEEQKEKARKWLEENEK